MTNIRSYAERPALECSRVRCVHVCASSTISFPEDCALHGIVAWRVSLPGVLFPFVARSKEEYCNAARLVCLGEF